MAADEVDLPRYLGTWFEIARFDERFQRGCFATQATYTAGDAGEIKVVNRCRRSSLTGPWRSVSGRGRVQEGSRGARLKVNFFGPFWGDYWVLDHDTSYTYAAIGDPRRRHLWILSRTPQMSDVTYAQITARLAAQGFATEQLTLTPQPPEHSSIAGPG